MMATRTATRTIIAITSGSVTEPQDHHAVDLTPRLHSELVSALLSLYEQDGLAQAQLATRVGKALDHAADDND